MLWRFGIGCHQVPYSYGCASIVIGVVVVKVGGTQGVEHLVGKGAGTEIVFTRAFKCKIECIDPFLVDKDLILVEVPFMWSK
jgi:hypothetical protein